MHRCSQLAFFGSALGFAFAAFAQAPPDLTSLPTDPMDMSLWFELARTLGLPGIFGYVFYRVGQMDGVPIRLDRATQEKLDDFLTAVNDNGDKMDKLLDLQEEIIEKLEK